MEPSPAPGRHAPAGSILRLPPGPARSLTHEITLRHPADFPGWRRAARRLLAAEVAPEAVSWRVDATQPSLFEPEIAPEDEEASPCRVPRHLVRLAEQAALHADPDRFALLYRVSWRVTHGERAILLRSGERDVARLEAMAAAVRRAAHKLRTLARFREVATSTGPWLIAWFEPEHHVLEHCAPHFQARFAGRRWSVIAPGGSVHGDGQKIVLAPGAPRREVPPPGAADSAWQAWADRLRRPATAAPSAAVLPLRRRAGPAATLLLVGGRCRHEVPEVQLRLLARAIAEAGLQEDACHRTDVRAGGRGGLLAERARLRPDLVVALGGAAAEALLERPVSLPLERGRVMPLDDGSRLLVTTEPASILALPDSTAQGREYRRFVADLLLAVPFQRRAA